MANTDEAHKAKRSQKRKDRQQRREERRIAKAEARLEDQPKPSFSVQTVKNGKKSLPGFLAKNTALICRWLRDYLTLMNKADDACIPWLKEMDVERMLQLKEDYVQISLFIDMTMQLLTAQPSSPAAKAEDAQKSEEDESIESSSAQNGDATA